MNCRLTADDIGRIAKHIAKAIEEYPIENAVAYVRCEYLTYDPNPDDQRWELALEILINTDQDLPRYEILCKDPNFDAILNMVASRAIWMATSGLHRCRLCNSERLSLTRDGLCEGCADEA